MHNHRHLEFKSEWVPAKGEKILLFKLSVVHILLHLNKKEAWIDRILTQNIAFPNDEITLDVIFLRTVDSWIKK